MGKTWVYPESYIPYNIFRYIEKGKAEFCIDGEEITVKENQIVYIPQGCRMSCRALSESFEFYSLRFTTSVFYEGEDVLKEYYGIPRIIENENEDYYFKEICKWVKKDCRVKMIWSADCEEKERRVGSWRSFIYHDQYLSHLVYLNLRRMKAALVR